MNDSPSGRPDLDAEPRNGPNLDPGSLSEGVSASLSELERKLKLLESELAAVSHRGPGGPTQQPPQGETTSPAAPATGPESTWESGSEAERHGSEAERHGSETERHGSGAQSAGDEAERSGGEAEWSRGGPEWSPGPPDPPSARRGQAPAVSTDDLELLLRFRDQLERYSRALVTDYGRLLSHLGIDVPPPTPWAGHAPSAPRGQPSGTEATPEGAATVGSVGAGAVGDPAGREAPAEPPNEYTGRGAVYEDILLEGSVALEVGPVAGVAALRELESRLGGLSGIEVGVRGFEGGRVVFDLRLDESRPLVHELRDALGGDVRVLDAAPGRLSIVLGATADGG